MRLVGFVLLVGFVAAYFWWIVAGVVIVAAVYYAPSVWGRVREFEERRRAGLAAVVARCDQQHAWVLAGDPRGFYGRYPPAVQL